MTLAASRVGVVGSVVAAALTVCTVVMPSAVAALNIGVRPCWEVACGDMLEVMARITLRSPTMRWRALPLAEIEPFHSTPICRVKIPRVL